MSAPVQLRPHKSGDYWFGLSNISIEVDSTLLDFTGAVIILQFKRYPTDTVAALALTTQGESPGIVADGTSFEVSGRIITLPPARYYWDCQVTIAAQPLTYLHGVWDIKQDISR